LNNYLLNVRWFFGLVCGKLLGLATKKKRKKNIL